MATSEDTKRLKIEVDAIMAKAQLSEFDQLLLRVIDRVEKMGLTFNALHALNLQDNATVSSLRKMDKELAALQERAAMVNKEFRTLGQSALGGSFNVGSRRGDADFFSDRVVPGGMGPAGATATAHAEAQAQAMSAQARREMNTNMATEGLRGRFEAAAKAVEKTKKAVKEVADEERHMVGVTYVGTQVLRTMGVEGSRAIEVVARQFLDMGLTMKEVLNSRLLGWTLLTASVIGLGEAITHILGGTEELDQKLGKLGKHASLLSMIGLKIDAPGVGELMQRELLSSIKSASVNDVGLTGSPSEQAADLRKMEQALQDVNDLMNTPGIRNAASRMGQVVTGVLGSGGNPEILETRIRLAREEFDRLQLTIHERGGEDNIFDKTRQSLERLAAETGKNAEFEEFMKSLFDQAKRGELGMKGLDEQTRDFKDSLELAKARSGAWKDSMSQVRETLATTAAEMKELNKAEDEIFKRGRSGFDNPLMRVFEDGREAMDRFLERFGKFGPTLVAEFKKVNDEVVNLQLFKTDFAAQRDLRGLGGDITRLERGLGGEDLAAADQARREAASDAQRALELARDSGAPAFELARLAGLVIQAGGGSLRDQVDREIREREITALKEQLELASGPQAQAFVLDQILSFTQNIGQLTSEERDFRLKSLQQRLAVGEAERQKVLIEIVNRAPELAIARELGPQPGAEGGFFDPFLDAASSLR